MSATTANVPKLSVVTALYESEMYLKDFWLQMIAAVSSLTDNFELILVNDGSPDNSLALALELYAQDSRIRVIDLSRNFGQHRAMMTGLTYARGELIFLTDCDLEVSPGVVLELHTELTRQGVDVVYGVQDRRHDPHLSRAAAGLFYQAFNLLSSVRIPENLLTARLMTRRYVDALILHRERELQIAGLWAATGFEQRPVLLTKSWKGRTSYTWTRRWKVLADGLTSFSVGPLLAVGTLGVAVFALALIGLIGVVIRWAFFGGFLEGWTSVIVSLWLLGGLNLLSLGVIGLYLSKVVIETKQRPYTIVRQVHERHPEVV